MVLSKVWIQRIYFCEHCKILRIRLLLGFYEIKYHCIFTDQYHRPSQYVVGSRHLNGANYIADFERQTSYCSLDPVTLSFPSNNNSLYDSITMSSSHKNYKDNIQTAFNQNQSKTSNQSSNFTQPSQDNSKKKAKGKNSTKYYPWWTSIMIKSFRQHPFVFVILYVK